MPESHSTLHQLNNECDEFPPESAEMTLSGGTDEDEAHNSRKKMRPENVTQKDHQACDTYTTGIACFLKFDVVLCNR